jgi:ParB family chromosome partitioning protein
MALGKGLGSLIPSKKVDFSSSNVGASAVAHPPVSAVKKEDQVWHIPLSEIVPNPDQPRKNFSHADLEDLIASVKEHGVLQPILVSEKATGGYELIAGERRFRASEMAGVATIPALIKKTTDQNRLEIALIENIQRQNLNPIEEAFAFKRLTDEFDLTQEEVGKRVGKSRPAIANTIRLLDLPEVIQRALIDGTIAFSKARTLLSLRNPKEQIDMFEKIMSAGMSSVDLESAIERKGQRSRKGMVRRDPQLMEVEKILENKFSTKVRITQKGERGTITIDYYSKEELKKILDEIG